MENIIIIGTSSTAVHAYTIIKEYSLYNVIGFAVDAIYKTTDTFLNFPLFEIEKLKDYIDIEKDYIFIAMLWNHLNGDRKRLYERLKKEGYKFGNIICPTARIRGKIGENCWIHDYTIIQNDAVIGDDVMIMAHSMVGDHAIVSSHCFMGTKSTVSGGCSVGEQTFIGINSTIFDDRHVGKKCIIGACSVVKRNLPDYCSCKTPSDNMVIKQYEEDIIEEKLQFKLNVK